MPTQAELALTAMYLSKGTRIRSQLIAALVALWRSLGGYRDADADRFVPAAVAMVLGGQKTTSALTVAYLAQQQAVALGRTASNGRQIRVPTPRVSGAAVRGGVDPLVVYRRPVQEVWRKLSQDVPFTQAVEMGEKRLIKTAETDIQLTKTNTARLVLEQDQDVTGYRRVLVGEENCGMCVIASTRTYFKQELLPIHPGCDCTVDPLYNGEQVDEDEILRSAHDAVQRTFGKKAADGRRVDYRKLLLVRENSEYGPTLSVAKHRFTSLNDLGRKTQN